MAPGRAWLTPGRHRRLWRGQIFGYSAHGCLGSRYIARPDFPDTAPSGPNLEYDPAFAALERAAEGRPEQAMGGVVTPAEPPEWGAVLEKGVELLGRTKDLRVAVHVTPRLCSTAAAWGVSSTVSPCSEVCSRSQWGSLHPELDPDDNNDPTMRVTALAALTVPSVLMALRMTPLLESRVLGPVSLADIAPPDGAPDNARIQGAFADAEFPALEASLAALVTGTSQLQGIDAVFGANGGGPDIAPLLNYFRQARQALEPRVAERRPVEGAAGTGNGAPAEGVPASAFAPARGSGGDILSREDVVRALDKISPTIRGTNLRALSRSSSSGAEARHHELS